jgi:hypothetical protein
MATTTTNFGWDIPQSTDLVKDGATAIAALGQDIDTAMVDLKGGTTGQVLAKASGTDLDFSWVAQDDSNAIQNAIVDAKGDLIGATAADTPARLAVGTNGQVLTADSTASTGLAWATPSAAGGMTLLATSSLTGASVTVSSISQSYKHLLVLFKGVYTSAGENMCFRLNGDSGSLYSWAQIRNVGTTVSGAITESGTSVIFSNGTISASTPVSRLGSATIWLYRYTDTDQQEFDAYSYADSGSLGSFNSHGQYNKSAAITSITYLPLAGNWSGGTAYLYGVS